LFENDNARHLSIMPPAVIRLLDSTGKKVLDSVSCDYEDSFCLDSFGELIDLHKDVEPKGTKSFIIARVQTWDHKQPDRAYYSYYNAYHLNKILFQTQIYLDKKLIHRLHVLNPLTNTDIIGNVQYFIVKASNSNTSKPPTAPAHAVDLNVPVKTANLIELSPTKASPTKAKNHLSLPPTIRTNLAPYAPGDLPPPSPTVKQVESGSSNSWTLTTPVSNVLVEEGEEGYKPPNIGISGIVRKMSQQISPRRESAQLGGASHRPSLSPRKQSEVVIESYKPTGREESLNSNSKLEGKGGLQIVTKQPTSPVFLYPSRTQENQTKVEVPAGAVTRFGQPVSDNEIPVITPRTAKSRRRSLSYQNAVSATGQTPTIQEWMTMVKEEEGEDEVAAEKEGGDYDSVKPFGSPTSLATPTSLSQSKPRKLSLFPQKVGADSKKDLIVPKEEADMDGITTYDAFLFATDNDFLESSRVRSIFKENALIAQDAVLFEMPAYTGESEEESPVMIIVDEPPVCEFCYPSERSLRQLSPFMQMFHRNKCYFVALLLMMAVFLFIFL
jgi:hypothetical protein